MSSLVARGIEMRAKIIKKAVHIRSLNVVPHLMNTYMLQHNHTVINCITLLYKEISTRLGYSYFDSYETGP